MRYIDTIIVHCSDTEDGNAASIRKYHREVRGWADIGYHYVIDRNAAIEKGRPVEVPGAHCQGENRTSIGICLVGKLEFTKDQLNALKTLVNDILKDFPAITRVRPHCAFLSAIKQGKTCPNPMVIDYMVASGLTR